MRYTFYALFMSLLPIMSYGQDLKEKLSNDTCACIADRTIDENSLVSCFQEGIIKYKSEIELLIDKESIVSEYEQGLTLGREMFFYMQQNLVQNCDTYYNFFENLREESFISMKESYSKTKIDSINIEINRNRTSDLLWERGNLYFSNNNFDKASEDFKESLLINPNHTQSLFFLGWLYERQENYIKAIEFYNKTLETTGSKEIILLIEIVKRKSNF